jgi:hypothetical protein
MTLVLDFVQSAFYAKGAVALDFAFEITPPLPLPIKVPNIGMALHAKHAVRANVTDAVFKAAWKNGDITSATRINWTIVPTTIQIKAAIWHSKPAVTVRLIQAPFSEWPIVNEQHRFKWGKWRHISNQIKTDWPGWPLIGCELSITWLPNPTSKGKNKTTNWLHTDITERWVNIYYSSAFGDFDRGYKLPFGPKPPSYICSNDYQPQKGTVTLNFTELALPATGAVTLNFSNFGNPVICVLDNGGGLIWPMPDLPTIDTTKPITPPRRRSYIMQPQLRCYRVSDNQEVNIISASWSISRSQWGANINLVCGSRGDKDMLFAGGPQEFKLLINGYEFYGLAEEPGVSAEFGQTTWTVSGRSSIAELASPHVAPRSYRNATAKSIAALALDELTGTGWTLDYQPTQFNVPAGVFSYQNKTPIEAIAQIAQAVGAMVYPDGATKTLRIVPQWPVAPWAIDSATADIAVHDDVIINYSTQPAIAPLYNKVFVRAEQQGVEAGVRRTGTAGDKLAPDIVDPLITDNLAARQRGTAELANSGSKDNVTVILPVMDLLPPCLPGMVLGVSWQTDIYKALVDSVQISAQRGNDGSLTVRQTVGALRSNE